MARRGARRRLARSATFSGAALTDANLSHANLRRARFDGAVLERARLWGANLDNAVLAGVNLTGARLQEASLRGADPPPSHEEIRPSPAGHRHVAARPARRGDLPVHELPQRPERRVAVRLRRGIPRVLAAMVLVYLLFIGVYYATDAVVHVADGSVTHDVSELAVFSLLAMTTSGDAAVGLAARPDAVNLLTSVQAFLGVTLFGLLGFVFGNPIRR